VRRPRAVTGGPVARSADCGPAGQAEIFWLLAATNSEAPFVRISWDINEFLLNIDYRDLLKALKKCNNYSKKLVILAIIDKI
jgi:hypothetical protein